MSSAEGHHQVGGKCRRWTNAEDEHLCKVYADGDSASIADEMDRTPAGIRHRAAHLGLKKTVRYFQNDVGRRPVAAVGTERTKANGTVWRKTAPEPGAGTWRRAHVDEWEKHNGPLPPHHFVAFRDGDRSNCTIENLDLRSRGDAIQERSFNRFGPELCGAIRTLSAIKRRIADREK